MYTLLLYIARPIVKGSYRKTTFQASPSQAFSVEGFITFSTLIERQSVMKFLALGFFIRLQSNKDDIVSLLLPLLILVFQK
jgi:hypothetical protein